MRKLFGTDGIRGVANTFPMNPEIALRIGKAAGTYFESKGDCVFIGKDTRISGDMLEAAVAAGVASSGLEVHLCGIIPTPGVSYLTYSNSAACGIVISASHNPHEDNGIKLFGPGGYKLSDQQENSLEDLIFKAPEIEKNKKTVKPGKIRTRINASSSYNEFLKTTIRAGLSLKGLNLVLDCSNGATWQIAPDLFTEMGANITCIGVTPDGININEKCGSEHPRLLAETVSVAGADIGIAFDGDGDRLVIVDEKGNVLSGDQVMAVCARYLDEIGKLTGSAIVTTIMSNTGLARYLDKHQIQCVSSNVGDRYVMQKMLETGAVLGGENSGHIIFHQHHHTGDGMLAAIQFLAAAKHFSLPVSELAGFLTVFPQKMINVDVHEKPDIHTLEPVKKCISAIEKSLGDDGRVLVRYSGTQLLCRVMVEGPDIEITEKYCLQIAETIRKTIG